MKAPDKSGF